jgi:hypothetical protein
VAQVEIYKLRKTVHPEIRNYSVFDYMDRGKAPDPAHYIKEWAGQMHGTLPMTISGRLLLDTPADYHGGALKNGDIAVVNGQPYYLDQYSGHKFVELDSFDTSGIRQAIHAEYGWFVDLEEARPISNELADVCENIGVPCGYYGKQSANGSFSSDRPFLPGTGEEENLNFLHPQFLKGDEAQPFVELLTELSETEGTQWREISVYLRERSPITLQDLQDAREQFAPELLLPEAIRPLYAHIPADADKSELAYLAAKVEGMDDEQRKIFDAVTGLGWHCGSVIELINLTENLNCFELQPAFSEEAYGEHRLEWDYDDCAEVISRLEKSKDPAERSLAKHIQILHRAVDNEAYGYQLAKEEGGVFTSHGLISQESGLEAVYRGIQDLPEEYRTSAPIPFHALVNPASEAERGAGVRNTPAERTAVGDKPSVLAEIAEAREGQRKDPAPREVPASIPGKKKTDPEL